MAMFEGLAEQIKALNNDAKTVTNCEKAKALRKKLLSIGFTIAAIGAICVIACFSGFLFSITQNASKIAQDGGQVITIVVPFFLIMPSALVLGVGVRIASLGFKIVIAGYTTNLIDEAVGNNCPKCGDRIAADEIFCSQCGCQLRRECPNCKTVNTHKDHFCKKCGTEL